MFAQKQARRRVSAEVAPCKAVKHFLTSLGRHLKNHTASAFAAVDAAAELRAQAEAGRLCAAAVDVLAEVGEASAVPSLLRCAELVTAASKPVVDALGTLGIAARRVAACRQRL